MDWEEEGMGSILEKITLYDILGYLLSGCFLEIIICLEYILEKWISTDGMLMQQKEALEKFNSFYSCIYRWRILLGINIIRGIYVDK